MIAAFLPIPDGYQLAELEL